jgi:hypothetical protein
MKLVGLNEGVSFFATDLHRWGKITNTILAF